MWLKANNAKIVKDISLQCPNLQIMPFTILTNKNLPQNFIVSLTLLLLKVDFHFKKIFVLDFFSKVLG